MAQKPTNLLLPTNTLAGAITPSGLTPTTRSEAEAALTHNTSTQTDSAAPPFSTTSTNPRRTNLIRASSTHYEAALQEAHDQASASSDLSLSSPTLPSTADFPAPGEGVVPRHAGVSVGGGQAEMVRKAKPLGLSLEALGRGPSWSGQDYKRVLQGPLMGELREDEAVGYESAGEGLK
ncbi:unnamed protein product [Periconia digitata]|uniref:Uncharacterized protein n=1 Tax=Periconia digitata TaxID=1303443 RepID=A0A9W4XD16_9PLEO|nr:unnamed protein product [Periconia digitata]